MDSKVKNPNFSEYCGDWRQKLIRKRSLYSFTFRLYSGKWGFQRWFRPSSRSATDPHTHTHILSLLLAFKFACCQSTNLKSINSSWLWYVFNRLINSKFNYFTLKVHRLKSNDIKIYVYFSLLFRFRLKLNWPPNWSVWKANATVCRKVGRQSIN